MKKAISILLLSFFLFNIIGYKLFFYYQLTEADSRIQAKIDVLHESDESLFTVKIPLRLPYHTDWKHYESVEGEMTYKNTTYKYVKRKVLRDTLILLCVKYQEKSVIENNSSEYFKKVNDLDTDNSRKQEIKHTKEEYYQKSEVSLIAFYPLKIFGSLSLIRDLKTSSYHAKLERPPIYLLPSA
ncbi:MAG: hypothetical protein WBJ10_10780 [Daejeonella sp.]|uniref:hypothetical protein n=1 Tax=Daejeonella sp. TaxID=2805397 RepID=UPI003C731D74